MGRDVLARTVYGGQISLLIGVSAVLVSLTFGVLVGALRLLWRNHRQCVDALYRSHVFNSFALSSDRDVQFFGGRAQFRRIWAHPQRQRDRDCGGDRADQLDVPGRLVRANFLSLKQRDFVLAAECLGVRNRDVIVRHILPNSLAPIIVAATLGVAGAILSEAYVSFLGLGVQPPTASWGNMLENAYNYLESAPWLWFFPGLFPSSPCSASTSSATACAMPSTRARSGRGKLTDESVGIPGIFDSGVNVVLYFSQ